MVKGEITLRNESGLHARPASLFVKEASKYNSEIKVIKGNKECNAKSIIGVLSMAVAKGDLITIQAEGPDEDMAVNNLIDFISKLEG
jgi:phosphocarrier protein